MSKSPIKGWVCDALLMVGEGRDKDVSDVIILRGSDSQSIYLIRMKSTPLV